jgi:HK97 family phage major capsid protein
MNIKALIEKKNELKAEYRALYETAVQENRSLEGDAREAELSAQIAELNTQIETEENRAAQEADTVENIKSEEEKREMENKLTQEQEVRAVEQFIRKQEGEELRAVTAGTGVGALTVPTHLSNMIVEKLFEVAPLFARTKNFTPVNGYLEILREQTLGSSTAVGFVGEMTDIAKGDFSMDKVRLDQKRVGTAIELSQHLVNDSGIDVVNYSTNLLSRRLGMTLDRNILNGDKATQFEGLLNALSIEDVDAGSADGITVDELLDVYNTMNPSYIGGAVWVVSRKTT